MFGAAGRLPVFKVHELVLVSDSVEALKNEAGFFQVTAPTGQTMEIRLEHGYFRLQGEFHRPENMRTDHLWLIVKVGELKPNNTPIEHAGEPETQMQ
jgi:hypothetical protein